MISPSTPKGKMDITTYRAEEPEIATVGMGTAIAVHGGELREFLSRAVYLARITLQYLNCLLLRARDLLL